MRHVSWIFILVLGGAFSASGVPMSGARVQERMAADVGAGRPLVAHVVVPLCDNDHQGIVPVPKHLGNGQDPDGNLYWGAMYGVKTFLARKAGWRKIDCADTLPKGVLERLVFHKKMQLGDRPVDVYLVAEAWDGALMKDALGRFLAICGGTINETLAVQLDVRKVKLAIGSKAHLAAFVGHNGLMDNQLPKVKTSEKDRLPMSAVVLACSSHAYFLDILQSSEVHPLLLTTGFMCPEAYTLDAVVGTWLLGGDEAAVKEAAAQAYHEYQRCGMKGARGLFWCTKGQ